MVMPDPSDRKWVLLAMADYDDHDPKDYHAKYGYGPARVYHVVHDGKLYPSKAMAARAMEHETGQPFDNQFPGGWDVAERVAKLGFEIYVDGAAAPPGRYVVQRLPLEARVVDKYSITPRAGEIEAQRAEALLVEQFVAAQGRADDFGHHAIVTPTGDGLVTDLFDDRRHVLYEAKSRVDRATLRLALGQLLDYRHCLRADGIRVDEMRLLAPERPADDLVGLLAEYGIGVVWRDGDRFVDEPA